MVANEKWADSSLHQCINYNHDYITALRCRLHLVYIVVGAIAALIIIVCITVCVCYACSKKEEAYV